MSKSAIYTRDEAARLIEMFENILVENGISVPSPEDDDRDPDDNLGLYGSVYSDLLDDVEHRLARLFAYNKAGAEVVVGKFGGTY